MASIENLSRKEFMDAREKVAKILYPALVDSSERERAERLLEAGVIDLDSPALQRTPYRATVVHD